jgi:hypothetical protein
MATSSDALYCIELYDAPVLRLKAGEKKPPIDANFFDVATRDPATLKQLWWAGPNGSEHDYNVAVLCDGLLVFDLDPARHPGCVERFLELAGVTSLEQLGTLVVQTANDGYHVVYKLPRDYERHLSGLKVAIPGIDIRSYHNYIVGCGSMLNPDLNRVTGTGMYWPKCEVPVKEAPVWLLDACDETQVYKQKPGELNDTDASRVAYIDFLVRTEHAVEGLGGDDRTFRTALKGRDYGLFEETTLELMSIYWNPYCSPPWHRLELEKKVANAYAYAKGEAGALDVARLFERAVILPASPETLAQLAIPVNALTVWPDMVPVMHDRNLPVINPDFIMFPLLARGYTTAIAGAGGLGKSALARAISLHVAAGMPFIDHSTQQCSVALYSTEDRMQDLHRAFVVAEEAYGFGSATDGRIYHVPHKPRLKLIRQGKQSAEIVTELVDYLKNGLRRIPDLGLFIVDPFRAIHSARENDNDSMSLLIEDVLADIADELNIAVMFIHHPPKDSKETIDNPFRGASTIRETPRLVWEMTPLDHPTDKIVKISGVKHNPLDPKDIPEMHFRLASHRLLANPSVKAAVMWAHMGAEQVASTRRTAILSLMAYLYDTRLKEVNTADRLALSLKTVARAMSTQRLARIRKNKAELYAVDLQACVEELQTMFTFPVPFTGGNGKRYLFKHDGRGNVFNTVEQTVMVPALVRPPNDDDLLADPAFNALIGDVFH